MAGKKITWSDFDLFAVEGWLLAFDCSTSRSPPCIIHDSIIIIAFAITAEDGASCVENLKVKMKKYKKRTKASVFFQVSGPVESNDPEGCKVLTKL